MYEKAQWGLLSRQLASELRARPDDFTRPHEPTKPPGGHPVTDIDNAGWSTLGRQFAAEEAQRRTEQRDAGLLPPGTIIAMVATLRSDLIKRGLDLSRIAAGMDALADAGWQLPADQWLHLAGDTWHDVMVQDADATPST